MNNLIKKSRVHRFNYRESVVGAWQKALLMMVMTFGMGALFAQQTWNFSYTGSVQTFTATTAGTYDLQVWGASGGNDGQIGGKGGYATAKMALTAGQSIMIYVAGQGTGCVTNTGGGWNGGGNAGGSGCSGGGGGATDIRSGGTALANRVIVAGGGGGGGNGSLGVGGAGGGLTGQSNSGGGGTQSAGGSGSGAGSLGQGGNRSGDGGGGGGGYYGGGAATSDAGGGGGSGYVSSSLSSASLIAGNLSMPNPSGGTMTGRSGHGYARITLSSSASISQTATISCNGASTGALTAVGAGGTAPYTYSWSNGATSAAITGLAAGTYTVTVTATGGFSATASSTLTQPTAVSATISSQVNVLCNGASTGSATASATGGTGTKTYLWSNGAAVATATGLAAGAYTVTATDANGCTSAASVTITQPVAASTTITSQTNVLCNGASTGAATASTAGGTSPYTYAWSNAATGATVTGLAAGTYGVTSTDANGCTSTASVIITQPTAIVIPTLTSLNITCNGLSNGTLTAVPSGGVSPYTYAWSNASTSATATGLAVGTFTVTVTDANGCTQTKSKAITQPTAVSASISSQVNVACNGGSTGSATATSTGGTGTKTYAWSASAGSATTATATGLAAGSYTVTATDANGCTSTATVTITQPTVVSASIASQVNVLCNGASTGSATASATGGTGTKTYLWSNGAAVATAAGLAAGAYTVTATDANGCTSIATVTITQPTAALTTISSQTNVLCNGASTGAAAASTTGGATPYSYVWSNGATTASITGLAAGTYGVTATDANGCTSTASATITQPTAIVIPTLTSLNITCNGLSNGTLTAVPSGGVSPYTYAWSNANTGATATGLAVGTFTVTVTDANGCASTSTSTVTEPAVLTSVIAIDSNVTCNGLANGGATATATGGTAPYVYTWSNSATGATASGLAAGTYTVIVTDSNGCTSTANDSVSEPTAMIAMITVDSNVSCNGGADAGLTVMVSGGASPYAYNWSNASTTASITGVAAGTFTAMITDANNCMVSATDTTTEPTALSLGLTMDAAVACFGATDGAASAVVAGGTMPYVYTWSNGDITLSTMGLAAGTYSIVATDSNGCMIMDSIMIAGPASAMIVVVNETSGIVCDGDATGALEATANGGWGVYSFEWNTTETTSAISGLTEGSYTVNVTDSIGCLETATESIVHQFELPVVNLGADTTICNDASIELNAGNDGANYAWSTTDSTQTIVVNDSSAYSVIVTDTNGCMNTDTIMISLDDCTGINEMESKLSLVVYPNPSRGVFQIESNGFNLNESTITIIDLVGNLVTTIRPQGAVRETITLNQSSGVYFLSIEVDGNVAQQRIIIQ